MSVSSSFSRMANTLNVSSGGTVQDSIPNTNPTEISAGTTVSGITASGITQYVAGSAVNTVVTGKYQLSFDNDDLYLQSGTQIVQSGGDSFNIQVKSEFYSYYGLINPNEEFSFQTVQNGGTAFNTTLTGDATTMTPGVGARFYLQTISALQTIESGGVASGTHVEGSKNH